MELIDKSALVAEIERRRVSNAKERYFGRLIEDNYFLDFIDTLEVEDPYEQLIQYPSRELAIKAHAEDYSWNIESELFQQLTPEQQKLWRKEIEQACISGGYSGLNLAKDPRYKENLEVKEVDLEEETDKWYNNEASKEFENILYEDIEKCAKHFFELGQVSNKTQKGEKV